MRNKIASISLVVVLTLGAGLVGCTGEYMPEIGEYSLVISTAEGGDVTTPGGGTFTYYVGQVVSLVAVADDGYCFANWAGDVGTIADPNGASTTITMNDDYLVVANFEVIESARYSLIISSTVGGLVTTPGEGTFSYDGGTTVNLVATPDSGCQFVNWTGNVHTIGDVNAASITITINEDYSVIANFEAIPPGQYTLTISSTIGGSVSTPGQGTFRYDTGAVVDLVTESEEGYKFFKWTGDAENIEMMSSYNVTTSMKHVQLPLHFLITMDGNYAITAHFIPRWLIPTG